MKSNRPLEILYENYYVSPYIAIQNMSPEELLSAFEEAVKIDTGVYKIFENIIAGSSKNNTIKEAVASLDKDSVAYLHAIEKIIEHTKKGNDVTFNKKFQMFLEAGQRDPKTGRFIKTSSATKPGMFSKIGSWLGNTAKKVGGAVTDFGRGVVSGYKGTSSGAPSNVPSPTSVTQKIKPVNKKYPGDLSMYTPDKATAVSIDQAVGDFGLSPEEENALEKGMVLNVTDKSGNIVQFRYRNGLLNGLKVKAVQPTIPTPKAAPKAAPKVVPKVVPKVTPKAAPKVARKVVPENKNQFDVTLHQVLKEFNNSNNRTSIE